MIYKNVEFFNVGELIENENGSVSWLRVPQKVYDGLDGEQGKAMCKNSTGVELRFNMLSDSVKMFRDVLRIKKHVKKTLAKNKK